MGNNLVLVWIDLPDQDGEESLYATSLGNSLFKIEEIPFLAKGINYMDIVHCEEKDDSPRLVTQVIEPSGYQTLFARFKLEMRDPKIIREITELKKLGITYRRSGLLVFSLNIPPEADPVQVNEKIRSLQKANIIEIDDDRSEIGLAERLMRTLKALNRTGMPLANGLAFDEEFDL